LGSERSGTHKPDDIIICFWLFLLDRESDFIMYLWTSVNPVDDFYFWIKILTFSNLKTPPKKKYFVKLA